MGTPPSVSGMPAPVAEDDDEEPLIIEDNFMGMDRKLSCTGKRAPYLRRVLGEISDTRKVSNSELLF